MPAKNPRKYTVLAPRPSIGARVFGDISKAAKYAKEMAVKLQKPTTLVDHFGNTVKINPWR